MIASTAYTRPDAPARKFALRLLPAQPPSPPPPAGWLAKQLIMLDAAVHRAQEAPGRNHGRPPPLEMQGLRVWRAGHWLGGMQRLPVHCLAFRLVTVAIIQETNGCGWLLAPLPASPRVHPAPQNTGSHHVWKAAACSYSWSLAMAWCATLPSVSRGGATDGSSSNPSGTRHNDNDRNLCTWASSKAGCSRSSEQRNAHKLPAACSRDGCRAVIRGAPAAVTR